MWFLRSLIILIGVIAFLWVGMNNADQKVDFKFFTKEYPAMAGRATIAAVIRESGYEPVGDFTLPDSAWWEDYYTPLDAKLPSLKEKYERDQVALGVIAMAEAEIDMRRRFGQSYGYQFFVARKVG